MSGRRTPGHREARPYRSATVDCRPVYIARNLLLGGTQEFDVAAKLVGRFELELTDATAAVRAARVLSRTTDR